MIAERKKTAIRYWERRRLIFNALLVFQAWIGWTISNTFTVANDDIHGARITDPGVLWQFVLIFAVLNAVFCIGYAVEYFLSDTPKKYWPVYFRFVLFIAICGTCMWGLGSRAGKIAKVAAYTKAGMYQTEDQTAQPRRFCGAKPTQDH